MWHPHELHDDDKLSKKTFTAFSVVPNPQYGANLLLDWPLKKGKEGVEEGVSK